MMHFFYGKHNCYFTRKSKEVMSVRVSTQKGRRSITIETPYQEPTEALAKMYIKKLKTSVTTTSNNHREAHLTRICQHKQALMEYAQWYKDPKSGYGDRKDLLINMIQARVYRLKRAKSCLNPKCNGFH